MKKIVFFTCLASVLLISGIFVRNFSAVESGDSVKPVPSPTDTVPPSVAAPDIQRQAPQSISSDSGTFELGGSGEWSAWTDNGANATFSVVEGGVDEDGLALQVDINTVGANVWDVQIVQPSMAINASLIQKVSTWIKGPLGAEVQLSIEDVVDYKSIQYVNVTTVGDWQKVVIEFDTQMDNLRLAMHFSSPYNEDKTLLIDAINLEDR